MQLNAHCGTLYYMRNTLTIRTDKALREALLHRAQAQNKTVSEIVRDILEQALIEKPLEEKIRHLRGRLKLTDDANDSWQNQLRERNWRS